MPTLAPYPYQWIPQPTPMLYLPIQHVLPEYLTSMYFPMANSSTSGTDSPPNEFFPSHPHLSSLSSSFEENNNNLSMDDMELMKELEDFLSPAL